MFNVKWSAMPADIQHSTLNIQHSTSASRRGEPFGIVAVFAAAIAFVNPRGNFPIDDDWDFALAAWRFAKSGHFQFTAFTAVSLRAQVLWGALWTRLFGESFDVLRMSTMLLAAATLVIVHRTLLQAGVARFGRITATLALAFHPIFLWSACTFMTEVPFVFASSVALFCFIRASDGEDGFAWTAAACAAAMTACFVRQTGIALLAAPLLLALFQRRKRDAAVIGGTIALFFAMLLFKREWMSGSPQEFAVHFRVWTESTFRLPEQIAGFDHYATFNAQNSALFFLPLVAPLVLLFRGARRTDFAIAGAFAALLLLRVQSLIAIGLPMPYFVSRYCCDIFAGNIFVDFGLGPLTLDGAYPFRLPYAMRIAITYASVILAVYLLWAVLRRASRANASLLAIGTALFGSLILFGSGLYVDRYSLDSAWPLAIALPLMIPWQSRAARAISVAALLVIGIFSTLATQEYFSWNRARWQAIADLRARGIAMTSINAGSEPFYLYELSHGDQRMRRIHQFGVGERAYTVAFEPLPGKRVIARYAFSGWFGLHKGEVLVLSS
jgi:hypothetical protein